MKLISQYKGLRKEIYVLFFGRIVTSLGSMIWPVLTLILTRKLGLNATQAALVTVGSGIFFLPANIIGGKLADKYNKKMIIVYCDMISIVFYLISAFIPLSLFTIAILMFAAACQSIEYPAYNTLIADLTLTKDRERAYSLTYLGMNMGLVAAPTIAGILFENHLNLSFLISGLSIAMSTILIFLNIKDITPIQEEGAQGEYQASKSGESLFAILKQNKLIALYALIMTLYWGAYGQYGYLMPLDMGQIHGDRGALIYGSISSLNSITVVLFTPILTRVFRNMVSTKKCITGQSLLMVGFICFLSFRGIVPAYYIAMFLFTLGEIMSTFVEGPYLTQRIPASHRGRINGVMSIAQSVLQGVMTLVVGGLYDKASPAIAWSFVLVILAVAICLTLVLIPTDKRRYPALYTK